MFYCASRRSKIRKTTTTTTAAAQVKRKVLNNNRLWWWGRRWRVFSAEWSELKGWKQLEEKTSKWEWYDEEGYMNVFSNYMNATTTTKTTTFAPKHTQQRASTHASVHNTAIMYQRTARPFAIAITKYRDIEHTTHTQANSAYIYTYTQTYTISWYTFWQRV